MGPLVENWFFLVIILFCIAMHFFGHGHGHGHGHKGDNRRQGAKGESSRAHEGDAASNPER